MQRRSSLSAIQRPTIESGQVRDQTGVRTAISGESKFSVNCVKLKPTKRPVQYQRIPAQKIIMIIECMLHKHRW